MKKKSYKFKLIVKKNFIIFIETNVYEKHKI